MTEANHPDPARVLEACSAYMKTEAMRAAVGLRLFTAIGEGAGSVAEIAEKCEASERGIRSLCDFLVVEGFLTKRDGTYGLSPDAAAFLDERSPMCLGSVVNFLASDFMNARWRNLPRAVREGGTTLEEGSTAPEAPVWVEFARSMAPMMMLPAQALSELASSRGQAWKVLDIAAGHGMFGIMYAKCNPGSRVVAVDWPDVLQLAKENAEKMRVAERYETLPGSAFEVSFGSDYDLVMLPNFIHHFDRETNGTLLRKVHAALKPGGKVAVVEFVPNDDRVSPPWPAQFSTMMLASTPAGDAYTFEEITSMLRDAGFSGVQRHDLLPSPQTLALASK